jgi:hypothetical protein
MDPRLWTWAAIGLMGVMVCVNRPVWAVAFTGPGLSTWGISCDDVGVAAGSTLTDAVLVLEGIRRSSPSASLQITLLRNPALGCQNSSFPQTDEIALTTLAGDDATNRIVLFFSGIDDPQSPVWKVFRRPFVMPQADGSKMEYSSATLELMDILGTEKTFGLGFRTEGTGTVQVDRISLQLSVLPFRGTGQPLAKTYSLIQEEFDSDGLAGWSIVDQGNLYAPSAWSITDGRLRQDNNTCQQNLQASAVDMLGTFAVFRASRGLADFQLAVDIRSEDDDAIGILFRYRDPDNYYRLSWDQQRRTRRLVKCDNGQFTVLAQDAVGYEIGKTYRVAIVARGPQFAVAIDGTPIFHAWDSEISQGAIGLYCCAQQGAIFDNLRVEAATNRMYRLMAPVGNLAGITGKPMRISIAPVIPIPSVRYWAQPPVTGAVFEKGEFRWTPTSSQTGLYRVGILAEAEDGFDSQTAQIQVQAAVNHPPQLEPIADQTVIEGDTLVVVPTATDPDPDADPIRYSCLHIPQGAIFSDDRFLWTPTLGQAGEYWISLIASDGTDGDIMRVKITVVPNQPPGFGAINPAVVSEGTTMTLVVPVSDPDGDPVELRLENPPVGVRLENGLLSWTPDYSQAGHYSITIVAFDGLLESRATVPITVLNTNRPPVIGQFPATQNLMIGRYLSIPIQAVDPDGDPVKISSPNLPPGANIEGNTLTWMPGTIQTGIFDIEIVASDGFSSQSKVIEIRVF